jgi:hypothetical protein
MTSQVENRPQCLLLLTGWLEVLNENPTLVLQTAGVMIHGVFGMTHGLIFLYDKPSKCLHQDLTERSDVFI